jgi:hypothetical protein
MRLKYVPKNGFWKVGPQANKQCTELLRGAPEPLMRKNKAVYADFDGTFYKFLSHLKRQIIRKAIEHSSYDSLVVREGRSSCICLRQNCWHPKKIAFKNRIHSELPRCAGS